ncbi:hypothetical protein AYO20_03229 [Fonsecaea nubica]|uniref:Uncharacterized protein n=1 Tax=Fonsecaea nubica TaxID=856822 RepID=A0A178D567_9EURO|nr:hypothetical protein AYO20_03229 [Fonsecaea nubica]OAL37380.1 hypothetical protein AYO20_03229 [Fonsecaea nubica]
MSFFSSNRFLLTILVISLGTACATVPVLLRRVKDAARAPPPDPPPPAKRLQKDSENSLKLETLRTLADGYSYDLRTSAIKIVASRTVRSRTRHLLLRDLASADETRRENALHALHMLLTHPALSDTICSHFRDPKTVRAIVLGLINVLPQHKVPVKEEPPDWRTQHWVEKMPPPSPIRPLDRPAHEAQLLEVFTVVVHSLSRRDTKYTAVMDAALDAGLVTKWLANYPFPCSSPDNSELNFRRYDVTRLFDRNAWLSDDLLMGDVILVVMQYPPARRQMREAGLTASSYREDIFTSGPDRGLWWNQGAGDRDRDRDRDWQDEDEDADEDNDVRMVNGEDTAGLAPPGNGAVGHHDNITTLWDEPSRPTTTRAAARLRSAERSQEEEHLRRRHREAIVVAERGTPLSRENILQRANSEILQPMNGVSEVEGELNGLLNLSETSRDARRDEDASELPHAADTAAVDATPASDGEDQLVKESTGEEDEGEEEEEEDEDGEETNRAQRRHREIEQLIEHDPEIQGTNEVQSKQQLSESSEEIAASATSTMEDDDGPKEHEDSS